MDIPIGQDLADLEKLTGIKKPRHIRENLRPFVILQLTDQKKKSGSTDLPTEREIKKALDNHLRSWRRWKTLNAFPEVGSLPYMIKGLGLKDQAELEAKCRFVREQRDEVNATHAQAATATASFVTAAGGRGEAFVLEQSGFYDLKLLKARTLANLRLDAVKSCNLSHGRQELVAVLTPPLLASADRFDELSAAFDWILEEERKDAPAPAATGNDSNPSEPGPSRQ